MHTTICSNYASAPRRSTLSTQFESMFDQLARDTTKCSRYPQMWTRTMLHLGGWGVTTASMEAEEDPGSIDAIWITARSLDPTGRYRRPFGGAGTGSASSASSIPPFSIPRGSCGTQRNWSRWDPGLQRHARRPNPTAGLGSRSAAARAIRRNGEVASGGLGEVFGWFSYLGVGGWRWCRWRWWRNSRRPAAATTASRRRGHADKVGNGQRE